MIEHPPENHQLLKKYTETYFYIRAPFSNKFWKIQTQSDQQQVLCLSDSHSLDQNLFLLEIQDASFLIKSKLYEGKKYLTFESQNTSSKIILAEKSNNENQLFSIKSADKGFFIFNFWKKPLDFNMQITQESSNIFVSCAQTTNNQTQIWHLEDVHNLTQRNIEFERNQRRVLQCLLQNQSKQGIKYNSYKINFPFQNIYENQSGRYFSFKNKPTFENEAQSITIHRLSKNSAFLGNLTLQIEDLIIHPSKKIIVVKHVNNQNFNYIIYGLNDDGSRCKIHSIQFSRNQRILFWNWVNNSTLFFVTKKKVLFIKVDQNHYQFVGESSHKLITIQEQIVNFIFDEQTNKGFITTSSEYIEKNQIYLLNFQGITLKKQRLIKAEFLLIAKIKTDNRAQQSSFLVTLYQNQLSIKNLKNKDKQFKIQCNYEGDKIIDIFANQIHNCLNILTENGYLYAYDILSGVLLFKDKILQQKISKVYKNSFNQGFSIFTQNQIMYDFSIPNQTILSWIMNNQNLPNQVDSAIKIIKNYIKQCQQSPGTIQLVPLLKEVQNTPKYEDLIKQIHSFDYDFKSYQNQIPSFKSSMILKKLSPQSSQQFDQNSLTESEQQQTEQSSNKIPVQDSSTNLRAFRMLAKPATRSTKTKQEEEVKLGKQEKKAQNQDQDNDEGSRVDRKSVRYFFAKKGYQQQLTKSINQLKDRQAKVEIYPIQKRSSVKQKLVLIDQNQFYQVWIKAQDQAKFNVYSIEDQTSKSKTKATVQQHRKNDFESLKTQILNNTQVIKALNKVKYVQSPIRYSPYHGENDDYFNKNGMNKTPHIVKYDTKKRIGSQNTVMKGQSDNKIAAFLKLIPQGATRQYQWLHLVGYKLNDNTDTYTANTINNLVFGTYEANRYMLNYEQAFMDLVNDQELKNKIQITLQCETENLLVKQNQYTTVFSDKIKYNYKIYKKSSSASAKQLSINTTTYWDVLSVVPHSPLQKKLVFQLFKYKIQNSQTIVRENRRMMMMASPKLDQQSKNFNLWNKQYPAIVSWSKPEKQGDLSITIEQNLKDELIAQLQLASKDDERFKNILTMVKQFKSVNKLTFKTLQNQGHMVYEFQGKINPSSAIVKKIYDHLTYTKQQIQSIQKENKQIQWIMKINTNQHGYLNNFHEYPIPDNYSFQLKIQDNREKVFSQHLKIKNIQHKLLINRILNSKGSDEKNWVSQHKFTGVIELNLAKDRRILMNGSLVYKDNRNWKLTSVANQFQIKELQVNLLNFDLEFREPTNSKVVKGLFNAKLELEKFNFSVIGRIQITPQTGKLQAGFFTKVHNFTWSDAFIVAKKFINQQKINKNLPLSTQFDQTFLQFSTTQNFRLYQGSQKLVRKGLTIHTQLSFPSVPYLPKLIPTQIYVTKAGLHLKSQISQSFMLKRQFLISNLKIQNELVIGSNFKLKGEAQTQLRENKIKGQLKIEKFRQRWSAFFNSQIHEDLIPIEIQKLRDIFSITKVYYGFQTTKVNSNDVRGEGVYYQIHVRALKNIKFSKDAIIIYQGGKLSIYGVEGLKLSQSQINCIGISSKISDANISLSPFEVCIFTDLSIQNQLFRCPLVLNGQVFQCIRQINLDEPWLNPWSICELAGIFKQKYFYLQRNFIFNLKANSNGVSTLMIISGGLYVQNNGIRQNAFKNYHNDIIFDLISRKISIVSSQSKTVFLSLEYKEKQEKHIQRQSNQVDKICDMLRRLFITSEMNI